MTMARELGCLIMIIIFYHHGVRPNEHQQFDALDKKDPLDTCTRNSTALICSSAVISKVLPNLSKESRFENLVIDDGDREVTIPWQHLIRTNSLNHVDLSKATLSCTCSNMWLAFWNTILKPIAPIESLAFEKDVLLWFLADVNRVCGDDCPKTVRDIYGLPYSVVVNETAWSQRCSSEKDTQPMVALQNYFKETCGFGSLNLSAKQVIFGQNKTDDVVVCKVLNDTVQEPAQKQCPTFKITTFLEEPLKPHTFKWCMDDNTAVLSVNNVKPNSSGWIICFGNGFLPQASAIPLLVITSPVFTRFEMIRANAKELHIKFQLHSYPLVDLRLYTWEGDKKGWQEVNLDDEYVSQKGRRGAVWFSRALQAMASTLTEGEIQFTEMDTVCRTDRYNFTACNTMGCAVQTFELKPDDENVLCAANADSPHSQQPVQRKLFNFLSKPGTEQGIVPSAVNEENTKIPEDPPQGPITVLIPFVLVACILLLTITAVLYRHWSSVRQKPKAETSTRVKINFNEEGIHSETSKPMLVEEADVAL